MQALSQLSYTPTEKTRIITGRADTANRTPRPSYGVRNPSRFRLPLCAGTGRIGGAQREFA